MDRLRQEETTRREKAKVKRLELEEKERVEALEAEVTRKRKKYQEEYVCLDVKPRWPCDKCKGPVNKTQGYYREYQIVPEIDIQMLTVSQTAAFVTQTDIFTAFRVEIIAEMTLIHICLGILGEKLQR